MKRGEFKFTTDCGCTDEEAIPTEEVQNMREPDFSWMLESWGQIQHEEWKHIDDEVADHHEQDCALTEGQRARCGLWRWGQRLYTRIPITGEPQSHWMVAQTLPSTPLFRSGREQRLLETDSTRQMLDILLTRTARKAELEHALLPQIEGFRGEDRVLESIRQVASPANFWSRQGSTSTTRKQVSSCFWWRSWIQGRRERRIERPIQGWGRNNGRHEEKEENVDGTKPRKVRHDQKQNQMATRCLRSTGHEFCGPQTPANDTV